MPLPTGQGKYARTPEQNARRRQAYADAKSLGLSVPEARAIRRQGEPSQSREKQWSTWSTRRKRQPRDNFPLELMRIVEAYNIRAGLLRRHHAGYRYLWFTYVKHNSQNLADRKVAGYNENLE